MKMWKVEHAHIRLQLFFLLVIQIIIVYTKKKDKEWVLYFLTAPGKGSKGGGGAGGGGGPALDECTEAEISIEEAQEKAAEILSADILSGLTDANWKARLTAIESFINVSYYY